MANSYDIKVMRKLEAQIESQARKITELEERLKNAS